MRAGALRARRSLRLLALTGIGQILRIQRVARMRTQVSRQTAAPARYRGSFAAVGHVAAAVEWRERDLPRNQLRIAAQRNHDDALRSGVDRIDVLGNGAGGILAAP